MTTEQLSVALLLGALVLLIAVAAVRFAAGTGMPSLLLYLAIGQILSTGLGFHPSYSTATVLGYCALVVILAEGGLTTKWSSIKGTVAPAAVLATVGTLISVLITGAITHWLLPIGWTTAFLLGAVVSSTDAAAVFSVLRRVPIPRRLSGMLEAESGFNDAPVVILVVALAHTFEEGGSHSSLSLLGLEAVIELIGGALIGMAVGWVGAWLLRAIALPAAGLYPLTAFTLAGLAFGLGSSLHLSGFLAVYVCGLVLGNSELPHKLAVRSFAEGLGWLAQIGLFVMLGMLVTLTEVTAQIVPALIVGATLLLVARPLSVLASVSWFGFGWRDQAFLSWAGLRGAVPIVLATIPASLNAAGTFGLLEAVFLMVCIFTLVQAPTLPRVAKALRLEEDQPRQLDVDTAPLGAFDAHLMQVNVGPGSKMHGLEVLELRLPPEAKITLVVRDGDSFVPAANTRLRRGDKLLVVTTSAALARAEERLREVSAAGRLARWRGWQPPAEEGKAAWWRARRQRAARKLAAMPGKLRNGNRDSPDQR